MKRLLLIAVPLLILSACAKKAESDVGVGKQIGSQTLKQVMPGEGPIDTPDHGKEFWLGVGAMGGAPGINANGVTQAHYLEDGTFIHTIQLNIERAPDGSFYEGWLVNPEGLRISTGHLRTPFGDVRHQLKYLGEKDLRFYTRVEVTLEADDGNPAAGTIVATAELTPRER